MDKKFYDENAFYVVPQKWGTFDSYSKEDKCIVTSLTEESCIAATRQYLKWKQEGFPETKKHEGTVGGKL